MNVARALAVLGLCWSLSAAAGESTITAVGRTNAVNYKDRALAACISEAYKGSPAGDDANITQSAFLEWTYYDDENGDPAVDRLVEKYLHRDYSNPVEGYAGARLDLLKCLDMYHSQELDEQIRKYVPRPNWIGNRPPKRKRK